MGVVCAAHRGRINPAFGSCRPLHIDYDAETRAMAAMDAADLVRCPTQWWIPGAVGPLRVVGCGAMVPAIEDHEGLIDCPACGVWFNRGDH